MPEITFLGTGTSNGIPVIGCDCDVCRSTDPRDRRTRTSAFVRYDGHAILIDTATELRAQALANDVRRVDAVLMTHAHADHTGGFDDLRRFNELQGAHIPVYADPGTASMLRERYAYTFTDLYPFYGGKPDLLLHEIGGPFELFGQEIIPIPVLHGRLPITGFRFGDLAYITDAKEIPASSMDVLAIWTSWSSTRCERAAPDALELLRGRRNYPNRAATTRLPGSPFARDESCRCPAPASAAY